MTKQEKVLRDKMVNTATNFNYDMSGEPNLDDAEYNQALLREFRDISGSLGIPTDVCYNEAGKIASVRVGKNVTPIPQGYDE